MAPLAAMLAAPSANGAFHGGDSSQAEEDQRLQTGCCHPRWTEASPPAGVKLANGRGSAGLITPPG